MFIFLLFMCVLCVLPVYSIFDGMCPRKDPPPGVVVVSPGTRLVLTCSGHVTVNGVKVVLNSSNINKSRPTSVRTTKSHPTSPVDEKNFPPTAVSSEHENLTHSDTELTVSPLIVHPTTGESDWEEKEVDSDDDYEEEEEEEGSRVTRGFKPRPQWKWNKQLMQKGDTNRGEVTFMSHGAALCLESVRTTDAGKYSCHHRGTETFAVKVVVADPPETPGLSCYKKSPRSKIRCEWRPQKPTATQPSCYLLLDKRNSAGIQQAPCSFSSDRCWCALEYNENELRTLHVAFLCVTGIMGNATSAPLYFNPLDMLRPDPPSNVSAHQVEQQEKKIKVTWKLPLTWIEKDNFYVIIYEIRYRPSASVNSQEKEIKRGHSFTITDALPGVEYLIQLRAKEEFDGQWSEWSSPVYARSWTDEVVKTDYSTTPMFDSTTLDDTGSGFTEDKCPDDPEKDTSPDDPVKFPHHVVWVSGLFAVISVILAVYIFRHKDKLMSKLNKFHLITNCGDVPPPSPPTPAAPEGQTLVNFVPQPEKEQPPSDTQEEEENEEQQALTGRTGAMNFNNTSYFFM